MDLVQGRKTERWLVAVAKQGKIFIFDPKVFAKVSNHKAEEFWMILRHELCHLYYEGLTGGRYPVWLNEGLACHFSGKKLILKNGDQKKLPRVFDYFDRADKDVYLIGQFWVEYFLKKFGRNKLMKLIKGIKEKTAPINNNVRNRPSPPRPRPRRTRRARHPSPTHAAALRGRQEGTFFTPRRWEANFFKVYGVKFDKKSLSKILIK